MEYKKVTPIVHDGKKFMPYPDRKPRDNAKLIILTQDNQIKEVMQVVAEKGRKFINEEQKIELFPQEIQGWWYTENKPKESFNKHERKEKQ